MDTLDVGKDGRKAQIQGGSLQRITVIQENLVLTHAPDIALRFVLLHCKRNHTSSQSQSICS